MTELNSTGTATRPWTEGDELVAVAEGGAAEDTLARLSSLPIGFIDGLAAALAGKRDKIDQIPWTEISDKPTFFSGSWLDLADRPTLGTAAAADVADFATAAQGALAATALQPGALIPWSTIDSVPAVLLGTTASFTTAQAAKLAGAAELGTPQSFTAAQGSTPVILTDAPTIATDGSLSNVFHLTLGGNRTLGNPTNLIPGTTYVWHVIQSTGGHSLAYGSYFKWSDGAAPTLSAAAGAKDMIVGIAFSDTELHCLFSGGDFK